MLYTILLFIAFKLKNGTSLEYICERKDMYWKKYATKKIY